MSRAAARKNISVLNRPGPFCDKPEIKASIRIIFVVSLTAVGIRIAKFNSEDTVFLVIPQEIQSIGVIERLILRNVQENIIVVQSNVQIIISAKDVECVEINICVASVLEAVEISCSDHFRRRQNDYFIEIAGDVEITKQEKSGMHLILSCREIEFHIL